MAVTRGPYAMQLNCGCIIQYEVEEIGKVRRCPEHGSMSVLPIPENLKEPTKPKLAEVKSIREPEPQIIAILEDMLARAKRGEVERIVIAGYNDRDGCFGHIRNGKSYALLGYLHAVTHFMTEDIGSMLTEPPRDHPTA